MEEIWKDVPGYEGIYSVSTTGLVTNYGRVVAGGRGREKPKLLKPRIDKKGYLRLDFVNKDGKRSMVGVHRVVALTFIPNPYNKPFVDHIDGDKQNNSIDNLRWCTMMENTHNPVTYERYKISMQSLKGRHLSDEHKRKLSEVRKGTHPSLETRMLQSKRRTESAKPILQLSPNGEVIREWRSVLLASEKLGIDKSAIYKCIAGKLHKTGGYKWKFK